MKKVLLMTYAALLTLALPVAQAAPVSSQSDAVFVQNGNCAAPFNLYATKSYAGGGGQITMGWTSTNAIQWNVGGYYNWTDSTGYHMGSFNVSTLTYPISISVPAGTRSITFQVTALCNVTQTYSTSSSYSAYFPN